MSNLQNIIETAYDSKDLEATAPNTELKHAIQEILKDLETGRLRIAEPTNGAVQNGEWKVNQWLKKAVLLFFRLYPSTLMEGGFTKFYDKVPLRFADNVDAQNQQGGQNISGNSGNNSDTMSENQLSHLKTRIVPPATIRRGAYLGPHTVIMPSFVNIGAYVGSGTMVDTWATVGSCAQIGQNVHLSGGVGIGGVLEPLQANPTIIEDNCFIGARSEIVEGVIVEKGAVISMGVFIGQSTRIYNRETGEIIYGRVPAGSVVVPGSLPSEDGKYSLNCAVIVKQVDEKTRSKTSINELLRL